jgi:bis(5'-nucleosyl)-tetraphosphatase (symmetrical)
MTTWVLGDVHGCFATLEALLGRLPVDWEHDRFFMVGDLVNRGPRSLDVLRWARRTHERLGGRFVTVLGNHDLHLLARDLEAAPAKRSDTLDEILAAPDRRELVEWLAARPFVHRDPGALLVHAGLLPSWSRDEAEELARAAEVELRDRRRRRGLLEEMRDAGEARQLVRAAGVFTRIRTLDSSGALSPFSGPPAEAAEGLRPWFELPGRWRGETPILFGHWAALGLYRENGVVGLDSGCVWGGALAALRLEDGFITQEPVRDEGLPDPGSQRDAAQADAPSPP